MVWPERSRLRLDARGRAAPEGPQAPPPDYTNPGAAVAETTVPANKASIAAIASLHAAVTLDLLGRRDANFTSALLTLARVPGVFDEAFRSYRFRIDRSPGCLVCGTPAAPAGDLDVALGEALGRLGPQ